MIQPSNRVFLDCEQPLFFFRFSEGSARERQRRAVKPREARNKGGSRRRKKRVPLVVICVSRTVCSTDQEKRETAPSLVHCQLNLIFTCDDLFTTLPQRNVENTWPVTTMPSNHVPFYSSLMQKLILAALNALAFSHVIVS